MLPFTFITPQFESGAECGPHAVARQPVFLPLFLPHYLPAVQGHRGACQSLVSACPHPTICPCRPARGQQTRNANCKVGAGTLLRVCGCVSPLHTGRVCLGVEQSRLCQDSPGARASMMRAPPPTPPAQKEEAKLAVIIGHYSNKGVSLSKLVPENCTLSKCREPEKC